MQCRRPRFNSWDGKIFWRRDRLLTPVFLGFPGSSTVKASACNAGDLGSIRGLGRSPGEGNGNPLQYSCLENPMDGGTWWATVHRVAKSRTRLSDFTHSLTHARSLVACGIKPLTRDRTWAPCIGRLESYPTGPPAKSHDMLLERNSKQLYQKVSRFYTFIKHKQFQFSRMNKVENETCYNPFLKHFIHFVGKTTTQK